MIFLKRDIKNVLLLIIFVGILGVSINVFAAGDSCSGVFGPEFISVLREHVYAPIKWLTPILLILLTSFDYAKVVFSGKKEDMSKVTNNFLKRAVAALIIFLAPDIILLIVDLVNKHSIASCLDSLK